MKCLSTALLLALVCPPAFAQWPPVRELHQQSTTVQIGSALPPVRTDLGPALAALPPAATGGVAVKLSVGPEAPNDPEGYQIEVTPQAISIVGHTPAGVFYGAETLAEMAHNGRCTEMKIRDWPAMRWRGVQIDLSRGPVASLDYLKKVVRNCARYKLNMLGLYMEHTFQLKGHPLIPPPGGALTPDEIRELVAYADRYYVTLLPEQQVFGHLHHVLKYERYADLAEVPHGNVLAPSEGTYQLIGDFYREAVPLFPGPFLHIGADETVELGSGRTKERAQREGLGKVYLEHLSRVAQMLAPAHKRLLFWGDVAVHYPALLKLLPSDAVAVAWSYEAHADYAKLLEPFTRAGLDRFVAPGASNWNRICPDYDVAFQNTAEFIEAGKTNHAMGALITTWNDDNEAVFQMTWPVLAYGAGCAWSDHPIDVAGFYHGYGEGEILEDLSKAHRLLRQLKLGSASNGAFWLDPFTAVGKHYDDRAQPAARDLRLCAEYALGRLLSQTDPDPSLVFAARRLDALGMKIQFAPEISAAYRDAWEHQNERGHVYHNLARIAGINGLLQDLREAVVLLKHQYADLWAAENRPYYLDNILVRYDLAAQLYHGKIQAVQAAWRQYDESQTLPKPEEVGL